MRDVPRVPPFDRPATYEDLVRVPGPGVAEILDGELHTTPRPAPVHAHVELAVANLLGPPFHYGRGGPGGWWILPEPELHLGADVVVPDFAGWRRARMARLPEAAFISLAPNWVCEIVSPSSAVIDRTKKPLIYARERVEHAWIIDPGARTLEVLRREGDRWRALASHPATALVRVEPFADIELDLQTLWPERA
jgi:Uma2 family endonuclease